MTMAPNRAQIQNGRVLEIGSYDVNGSVRGLFNQYDLAQYIGCDLLDGPGVDVVSPGHLLAYPDDAFDLTVSAECFEHDPSWSMTLTNMIRMTRPGGLVIFTCASVGRVEHGTRRTSAKDSPGTQAEGMNYYHNLDAAQVREAVDLDRELSNWTFHGCRSTFDLYFAGVKRGGLAAPMLPDAATVRTISAMMGPMPRLIRMPLRAMWRLTRNEVRYQRIAVPYWNALQRLGGQR